jgi:hypothetical protein
MYWEERSGATHLHYLGYLTEFGSRWVVMQDTRKQGRQKVMHAGTAFSGGPWLSGMLVCYIQLLAPMF